MMRSAPYFLICALFISQCNAEPQTTAPDLVSAEAATELEKISDSKLASELAELTKVYHDLQEWRAAIAMQTNSHKLFEQLQQSFKQAKMVPIQITGTKLHIDSDLVVATNAFFLRESPVLNAAQGERIEPKQTLLLLAEQWTPDNYRWAVLWSGKELGFALAAHVKTTSASPDHLPYSCPDTKALTAQSHALVEQVCGALKEWREQVLHSSQAAAFADVKEQLTAALQQAFTLEQLPIADEPGDALQPPPKPIILNEIKDRVLKSISYGISFYEDSLRLEKTETALQGAIKLEKISTRYQAMREKIEERKQLLEQRRDKKFSNYSQAVSKLAKLSRPDLDIGMSEINQYLSTTSACEQQTFKKLETHIQAYRDTQQVATRQWREDFIGLEECAP